MRYSWTSACAYCQASVEIICSNRPPRPQDKEYCDAWCEIGDIDALPPAEVLELRRYMEAEEAS